jgi:FlaA1/EpsC-like NDP-sugar epimerase
MNTLIKCNSFAKYLGRLPESSPYTKRFLLLALDTIFLSGSLLLAAFLRLDQFWPDLWNTHGWILLAFPVLCLPFFIKIGLYNAVLRYAGTEALWAVFKAVFLSFVLLLVLIQFAGSGSFPRSIPFIYFFISFIFLGATRLVYRHLYAGLRQTKDGLKKVIIYGAGSSGAQISRAFMMSSEFLPVALVDDNPDLQGRKLNGIRIFAPIKIADLVKRLQPDLLLLAMPSASRKRKREILNLLEPLSVEIKSLPHLEKIAGQTIGLEQVQDVAIEDLLGRDQVPPMRHLLEKCILGKSVLVTGAGGSIGSELCRQIAANSPKRLILFEQSEFALYTIKRELRDLYGDRLEIIPILGSVCHQRRVASVLKAMKVETIYHAAAYKHVPLVEYNPLEGVINNLFGTMRTALAAQECGVETMVLISTDKAVRPTNVMGASKRMAELVLQGLAAARSKTSFTMVRFGNVLDSSGSVVPLFRKQIHAGGPVTVTHPEINRYFMTIPEAVELVLQAGAMGQGGDVFVLNMGEPVRILDLAKKMIRLCGLTIRSGDNLDGDIEIIFSGLRPGEKLYEELLVGDNVSGTDHPMIMRAEEKFIEWSVLTDLLKTMDIACHNFDYETVRSSLRRCVDGYIPQGDWVDPIWRASNGAGYEQRTLVALKKKTT